MRTWIVIMRAWMVCLLLGLGLPAWAAQATDANGSVEDHMRAMDTDHDGMVSANEVRAYLEATHGKGYQEQLLGEMEARASSKSCASPFSRSFY